MGIPGGGFLGGGFINGSSSGGGGSPSGPAGGIDVTGTYPNALDVVGLRGQPIAATVPASGQVLTFDGTNWTPAAPAGGLPSQAGNAGKILTTDGSAASWTDTLVDVALTGNAAAVGIQSLLDVNITAAGGLVGSFGDNISLVTSNGTADFSGTGTVTIASVSADVSISADSGVSIGATTGGVTISADLAGGTIAHFAQALTFDGEDYTATLTAGTYAVNGAALVDLENNTDVRVPTAAAGDSSTRAASTEWVVSRDDPSRYIRWSDECLPGVIASSIQWAPSQNGASASVSANSATLAGAFGHRTFTTGTTNSGRAALSWETVAGQLPLVSPWSVGTLRLEWRVQIATLPTAIEDFRFSLSLGTGAGTAGDDFSSGIGIRCDSTNANWVLASRVLGSDVVGATQTLSFAVAAATWTWVILDLTSTTATVYMGTTRAAALAAGSRGSVTMVGATGLPVGPMIKMRKTVGNTARLAYLDFHRGEFSITTPR